MTAEPAAQSTALEQVLAETWPVMLDFDGPVTYLFINGRNRMVADQMRQALPRRVRHSGRPARHPRPAGHPALDRATHPPRAS